MECDKLLSVVISLGHKMLECGAEIYRVEESIVRICKAYNAKEVEVFAIPSSIIVTLDMGDNIKDTRSKRVFPKEIDLDRVDKLNNLSRYICAEKPTYIQIQNQLSKISENPHYPNPVVFICYAVIPAVFCLFFGGKISDAVVSAFIGIIIKIILDILNALKTNTVFINVICSAVSTAVALISVKITIAQNYDKIIIGTIMLLVPGLILTNAMRDFIMGDLMAGILRLIEAVLVATGIAIGVALVLSLFSLSTIGEKVI